MKPKLVFNIMLAILIACIVGSCYKYIDVFKKEDVALVDLILRVFFVFLLGTFAVISFDFYIRFIALINESKKESIFSITLVAAFGVLLYLAANYTLYSLLSISFLLLFLKAYFIFKKVARDKCTIQVISFFRKYVIAYGGIFIITLIFFLADFKYISFERYFQNIFNPQPSNEARIISNELLKLQELKIDITKLKVTTDSLIQSLSSISTKMGIALFFGAISISFYFFFKFVMPLFFQKKRKVEEATIVKELKTHYKTKELWYNSSDSLAFLAIMRPVISLSAGLISSVIFFKSYPNILSCLPIFFVTFLTTSFGFVMNDYFDIEKDKIDHPDRVLPMGLIKPSTALRLGIAISVTSLFLSIFISKYVFALNITTLGLLSIYSTINNRNGILANIITAFCASLTLLIAKTNLNFDLVIMSAVSTFLFVLGREIIFDVQDIKGDSAIKKISLPIMYGVKTSNKYVFILLLCNTFITLFASIFFRSISYFLFVGLLCNVLIWYSYLAYLRNPGKRSELLFMNLTRIAILLLIPALI